MDVQKKRRTWLFFERIVDVPKNEMKDLACFFPTYSIGRYYISIGFDHTVDVRKYN